MGNVFVNLIRSPCQTNRKRAEAKGARKRAARGQPLVAVCQQPIVKNLTAIYLVTPQNWSADGKVGSAVCPSSRELCDRTVYPVLTSIALR